MEFLQNDKSVYQHTISRELNGTCGWKQILGVHSKKEVEPNNDTPADIDQKKLDCLSNNQGGEQCNGFNVKWSLSIPFPLYSVDNPEQYVFVRNCRDNLGLFQALPDMGSLVVEEGQEKDVSLTWVFKGKYQQRALKYVHQYKVWYRWVKQEWNDFS